MSKNVLEIHNLHKSFKTGRQHKAAVLELSLQIAKGEVFGFLGPNGAGKSTTIKLIMDYIRPDSGTIRVSDQDTLSGQFKYNTGYLPEFPTFYEHLTGFETLLLSGRLSGISKKILRNRIPELFERMNLQSAIDQKVAGYSKGMKQRLGMANALVHNPDFLILDEPMSGLDPLGRNLMKELILELRSEGKTIFFSSHILSDIGELRDRIGIIHKGRLLYAGDLDTFLSENKNIEECFVHLIQQHEN